LECLRDLPERRGKYTVNFGDMQIGTVFIVA
jgi:hypothetical protein